MNTTPLPAEKALEQYFLEARSKLLDLAAILDRIQRGAEDLEIPDDLRLAKIRQALAILSALESDRAEQIQKIFSLEYDSAWKRPKPRF
ncbi:MAG TPA: hypothetical protein VGZ47_11070 [Gemmataceae bacterium]|jgi:hypothetical protein|nr:hypothetical protein [Gemmataceae bacterium]